MSSFSLNKSIPTTSRIKFRRNTRPTRPCFFDPCTPHCTPPLYPLGSACTPLLLPVPLLHQVPSGLCICCFFFVFRVYSLLSTPLSLNVLTRGPYQLHPQLLSTVSTLFNFCHACFSPHDLGLLLVCIFLFSSPCPYYNV